MPRNGDRRHTGLIRSRRVTASAVRAMERGRRALRDRHGPIDAAIYYYFDAPGPRQRAPSPSGRRWRVLSDPLVFFVTSNEFRRSGSFHGDFCRRVRHRAAAAAEAWQEPIAAPSDGGFRSRRRDHITTIWISRSVVVERRQEQPDCRAIPGAARQRDTTATQPRRSSSGTARRSACREHFRARARSRARAATSHVESCTHVDRREASTCHRKLARRFVDPTIASASPAAPAPCSIERSRGRRIVSPVSRSDNIARAPIAYTMATLRRMIGIFVTVGSESADTAHQFAGSRLLYVAGSVVSLSVVVLLVSGFVIRARRGGDVDCRWRRCSAARSVTISPLLDEPRATRCPAQPFVFALVAIALVAA